MLNSLAEAGRLTFHVAPLDLTELAREELAGEPGIAVAADGPVIVKGDAARLRQALRALLANAQRHAGGADRVEVEAAPDRAVLRVLDRGPGVPADAAERIFTRFWRVDPSRTGPGAGLGLSVVQAIARGHGGVARVRARDGGAGRGRRHLRDRAAGRIPASLTGPGGLHETLTKPWHPADAGRPDDGHASGRARLRPP